MYSKLDPVLQESIAPQPWIFFPPRRDVYEYDTRKNGCGPGACSTWTK